MQNRFTPPRASGERYSAPAVTVVEVALEAGFALSESDEMTLPVFGVVDENEW